MLEGLEAGDRAAELLALLHIRDAQVEDLLGPADLLCGKTNAGQLQHLVQGRPSVADLTQQCLGAQIDAVELQARQAPGLVHGRQPLALDAFAAGLDGKQADPALTGAARSTGSNDQQAGAVAVDHLAEQAIDDKALAFGAGRGLDILRAPAAAASERQGGGEAALGNGRKPGVFLRLISGQQQSGCGQAGGGEER
ncbi:hypothetical protein D3C81_1352680 [compost metagenome]